MTGNPLARDNHTVRINLIWADKVGFYLAALGLAFIAYLWGLAAIATGMTGADYLLQHEIRDALTCDMAVAASVWLVFRAADWMVGGPRRRAQRRA